MDIPMMNEINDNTNAAAEAVKTAILNAMPAAGIDQAALDAAVAEILAGMPTGGGLTSCIRKIQRGNATLTNGSETVDVTLSGFSNLAKMVVILNSFHGSDEDVGCRVNALTKTKLTIEGEGNNGFYISYQVIEFY